MSDKKFTPKLMKMDNIYKIKGFYLKIGYAMELLVGFVILFQVFLGSIDLARSIFYEYVLKFGTPVTYSQFETFLSHGLLLVVGVELVVMLTLHTPNSIIDALLFAISRKLLIAGKTSGMLDVLLGVFAIACLFLIRNYIHMHRKSLEENKTYTFHAYNYVTDITEELDLDIESNIGVTLGGFFYKKALEEGKSLVVGEKIQVGNALFTIKAMTEEDMIDLIEIRKVG